MIKITKYSYIIGKAIQLPFKWYITRNDDVINTDVVDYYIWTPLKLSA